MKVEMKAGVLVERKGNEMVVDSVELKAYVKAGSSVFEMAV